MNALSKVFAFILAILLLIYFPLYQSYEKQDAIAYQVAYQAVTKFVDNVRNKGYITPAMYDEFQRELNVGNYVFNVEMKHSQKVYTPVYTDPTNPATFQGTYEVQYDEYYDAQILPILYPDSTVPKDDPSRMYKLNIGDYFHVVVKNKNRTNATLLRDFLTLGNTGDPVVIYIPYGGMVLNEDY